ncbi:MAG: peptidoglycan-binding protein [Clostridia bacterium]|nr:peptidoglycan-binding protein [Clostridia bacterium]
MDLLKTLLIYMTLVLSSGTGVDPAVTPLTPDTLPTPTPYVTMAPTAVPTAEPTQEAYTTLTMGDRGDAVTRLQLRLRELGYLSASAAIDGIYGNQTRTAVREFQRAMGLSVDGVAGPRTQQLLFGTPASAVVTVSYVDQNGAILRQVTRDMPVSGVIYADTGLLGGSYRINGSTSYQITVTNGVAVPSSVVFNCSPTMTAAPTAAPTAVSSAVTVPVRYVDRNGTVLYTDYSVQLFRSGTIYANPSRVPAGYSLVSGASQYVTVTNGVASPAYVTFTYSAPVTAAPTATPVSMAYVTVRYCDENGAILATDTVSLIANSTIYPRSGLVPGYILNGTGSAYVIVSGGVATPSTVTFYYKKSVTAAPEGYVTVYYNDQYGNNLNTEVVAVTKSVYVYANSSMIPAGYTLSSTDKQWVRYNSGNPNPSTVTFTCHKNGSTPVPQVNVPVYYQDQNGTILATANQMLTASAYVYANDALVPAGYARTSAASRYVTVTNGIASPSAVTFTYRYSVTAAPTAVPTQVNVPVYYRDQNGNILATEIQVLTSSRYINANDALVPAGYTRTSSAYNYVMILNGAASPDSVTFSYRYSVTAAPTATPVPQVNVPVYYQDQNGRTLATEVQTLTASRYVNANDALVPAGYTRTSSSYRYVTVSNGAASPSSVIFTYRLNATATPVPQVNVPVYYQDQDGNILATEIQTLLSSGYIYPKDSMVPAGYSRTSANRVYVTVQNGAASPATVSFIYKNNITPTPVPQVNVPVYYADEGGSILATDQKVMTSSGYINANDARVPAGYTRTSAASSYVTVANGKASPSSVTFTYHRPATATPVPQVNVSVYYADEAGNILASDLVVMTSSGSIYANDALVPAGYMRTSAASSYVTIQNGHASPASVTFIYRKPATPTPVPQVNVPVYYVDESGSILASDQAVLIVTGDIYANDSLVPAGYTRTSAASARVTVTNGKASPSSVTFTYRKPATPTPVPQVNVPVYYQDAGGTLLNSTQVTMSASGYVYADNSMVPYAYELVSDAQVYVDVANGKASPSSVTFTYRNTVTPTPQPPETVYVSVVYREQGGSVLYSTQVPVTGGGYVYADDSVVPAGYVLTGPNSFYVSIENHMPNPSEVVFTYVNASTPTPTDVPPAPVTDQPTLPPGPAPASLTEMGKVAISGKITDISWYYDGNGREVVNFVDIMVAMGKINTRHQLENSFHVTLNDHTIDLDYNPKGSAVLAKDRVRIDPETYPALYPIVVDGKPYIPFEFFRDLGGYDYRIDGSTLYFNFIN